MRNQLQNRCDIFVQNRNVIKDEFGWENSYIYPLCASLYTSKNILADTAQMRACLDLLKDKTGIFSNFRSTSKMATVTMLSLSNQPEESLDNLLNVYSALKEIFWGSEYLTVAASIIVNMAAPSQYHDVVARTRMIYDRMKVAHPYLASREDAPFAALLALSELDDVHIEDEMEQCYVLCKPSFFSGNAVQSLSHALALGNRPAQEKCRRVIEIYDRLKSAGYKYGKSYELPTLGVLALLDVDTALLCEDIMQVDDYLRGQSGFGPLGIGARQRLMYAGILTMDDYIPETKTMELASINSVVSLVIAQQAAICAAIVAASAAAAASSSSSN